MDEQSLNLILRITGFAGIVALLFFFFRKKKPTGVKANPELEAKIQELRIQGAQRNKPGSRQLQNIRP